jgi:nucleotide-binding universal stress UspA family protein
MTGQTCAALAQQAVRLLETFAEHAQKLGIDPEAVLVALEGETAPLPWSEAAQAWLGCGQKGDALRE